MIRSHSHNQLTLAEFDWPFQVALDEESRWVKMSQLLSRELLLNFMSRLYIGVASSRRFHAKAALLNRGIELRVILK